MTETTQVNSKQNTQDPSNSSRDTPYFQYYSQLIHQQNMLSDTIRTSLYKQVTSQFSFTISNKVCLDLGAGSGILSLFCLKEGCKIVYAVEASDMADKLRYLLDKLKENKLNDNGGSKGETGVKGETGEIIVVKSKIEDLGTKIPHKSVDVLISEPIGVFLIHERMLESFIYARDLYLKDSGVIYPTTGTIYLSPFSDSVLFNETLGKAKSVTANELHEFSIPIKWTISVTGVLHGIASWFDCHFFPSPVNSTNSNSTNPNSSNEQALVLSTNPSLPQTHWQQIRFLFKEPLAVNSNDVVVGYLKCSVNCMRSYSLDAVVYVEDYYDNGVNKKERPNSRRSGKWELHDQVYYYPTGSYGYGGGNGQENYDFIQ